MRIIKTGEVVQKSYVRTYILSDLRPIRPIFHNLFNIILENTQHNAKHTIALLANEPRQYWQIDEFCREDFWRLLKQVTAESFNEQSMDHLIEDLKRYDHCQSFVIGKKSIIDHHKLQALMKITANGITVIAV